MEKKHRRKNISESQKGLEIAINQHKMLMNTLHEMYRRTDVQPRTIEILKAEINSTLDAIEDYKKKIKDENKTSHVVNMFDSIKKCNCGSAGCTCGEVSKPKGIAGSLFDSITKETKSDDTEYVERIKIPSVPETEKTLFCNRFVVNMSDLFIPEYMVKAVHFSTRGQLEVEIYDFVAEVDGEKYPILELLEEDLERKFTMSISHLTATGEIIYVEKYVGCAISDILRTPLRYKDIEASSIIISIQVDGVKYEAAN